MKHPVVLLHAVSPNPAQEAPSATPEQNPDQEHPLAIVQEVEVKWE